MTELAVIIPAYKVLYLEQTLNSLACQTNKNFNLYIGDDFSPSDLAVIINKFRDKLNISYTRFENNIGAKDLVKQWKRCIDLVNKREKWLWLFSDDDIADADCVENFYQTIAEKGDRFDVFRFNTITIDSNGNFLRSTPFGPEEESSVEMAFHLLKGERGNSMPDHIFKKDRYDECGGFVDTDFAQGADWATSMLLSQQKGLCIIPKAKVYWRYSGSNISSRTGENKNAMLKGHLQFINWVLDHFQYLTVSSFPVSSSMLQNAAKKNLSNVVIHHFRGFDFAGMLLLYNFYRHTFHFSVSAALFEILTIQESLWPALAKGHSLFIRAKNKLSLTQSVDL